MKTKLGWVCHRSNHSLCAFLYWMMFWLPLSGSLSMSVGRHWQRCYIHNDANGVTVTVAIVDVSSTIPTRPYKDWTLRFLKTSDDTKSQRHTLPCLPLVTPLRKALFARGPGPSTVLPSSWAIFGQICLSDDWLGWPLDPKRPSRCQCGPGWEIELEPPLHRSQPHPTYEPRLQWRVSGMTCTDCSYSELRVPSGCCILFFQW